MVCPAFLDSEEIRTPNRTGSGQVQPTGLPQTVYKILLLHAISMMPMSSCVKAFPAQYSIIQPRKGVEGT
jgi:hypothetical protein